MYLQRDIRGLDTILLLFQPYSLLFHMHTAMAIYVKLLGAIMVRPVTQIWAVHSVPTLQLNNPIV